MRKNIEGKRLSVLEAAVALGVSKFTVIRHIHAGFLKAVQVGRKFQIPIAEVERLLEPRDFSKEA